MWRMTSLSRTQCWRRRQIPCAASCARCRADRPPSRGHDASRNATRASSIELGLRPSRLELKCTHQRSTLPGLTGTTPPPIRCRKSRSAHTGYAATDLVADRACVAGGAWKRRGPVVATRMGPLAQCSGPAAASSCPNHCLRRQPGTCAGAMGGIGHDGHGIRGAACLARKCAASASAGAPRSGSLPSHRHGRGRRRTRCAGAHRGSMAFVIARHSAHGRRRDAAGRRCASRLRSTFAQRMPQCADSFDELHAASAVLGDKIACPRPNVQRPMHPYIAIARCWPLRMKENEARGADRRTTSGNRDRGTVAANERSEALDRSSDVGRNRGLAPGRRTAAASVASRAGTAGALLPAAEGTGRCKRTLRLARRTPVRTERDSSAGSARARAAPAPALRRGRCPVRGARECRAWKCGCWTTWGDRASPCSPHDRAKPLRPGRRRATRLAGRSWRSCRPTGKVGCCSSAWVRPIGSSSIIWRRRSSAILGERGVAPGRALAGRRSAPVPPTRRHAAAPALRPAADWVASRSMAGPNSTFSSAARPTVTACSIRCNCVGRPLALAARPTPHHCAGCAPTIRRMCRWPRWPVGEDGQLAAAFSLPVGRGSDARHKRQQWACAVCRRSRTGAGRARCPARRRRAHARLGNAGWREPAAGWLREAVSAAQGRPTRRGHAAGCATSCAVSCGAPAAAS